MNDQPAELPKLTLGDRMRLARMQSPRTRHLSRVEFADLLHITRNGPNAYEESDRLPQRAILEKWAAATGYPLEWFDPEGLVIKELRAPAPPPPSPRGRKRMPPSGGARRRRAANQNWKFRAAA